MNDQDFLQLLRGGNAEPGPDQPMDDSQMMTQMASLQSLESSTNMQKAIDDLSAFV